MDQDEVLPPSSMPKEVMDKLDPSKSARQNRQTAGTGLSVQITVPSYHAIFSDHGSSAAVHYSIYPMKYITF
jgi:hypothetical protein